MSRAKLIEELSRVQMHIKSPKDKNNNFGKYKYRTAEGIFRAVKRVMSAGFCLIISDEIIIVGDRFYIKACARFVYGEESICAYGYARESLDKKGMDLSQLTGATSSYARKYAAAGLFAIDDEDDADSFAPTGRTAAIPKAPAAPPDTIQFGKFKGKKMSEVPTPELKNYASWLKKQDKGNPMTDAFIKAVDAL